MRRALYSPGSSHEGIVFVSSPEQDWKENIQLTLAKVRESDWKTLSFLLLKPSLIEEKKFKAHSHNGEPGNSVGREQQQRLKTENTI